MKTNIIKKNINGILWHIPESLLAQDGISMDYLYDELKDIEKSIFSSNFGDHNTLMSQGPKLETQSISQKKFVQIKAGRRKIFGAMNLLDKGGDHDVYIKVYNCSSLLLKLKHLFVPSKAMREFDLSFKISQCGIPAIFSIASGNKKRKGILERSYLIIKKINNAVNLKEFFYDTNLSPNEKHVVIEKFGEITRLSLNNGILQTDFALNNFLVQRLDNKDFCVYLIDYERTKIYKRLAEEKKFWILAKLNRIGSDFSTCDKLRFLRSYLNCNKNLSNKLKTLPDIRKWLQDLDKETSRLLKEGAEKSWTDCINGERRYTKYKDSDLTGHYLSKYDTNILIDLINNFDRHEINRSTNICNSTNITSVVAGLQEKSKEHIFKIYKIKSNDSKLLYAFWQNANALQKGRLNIINPVGMFIKDCVFKNITSKTSDANSYIEGYLITHHIFSMQDLKESLHGVCQSEDRKRFLHRLARFICSLHNYGKFLTNLSTGDIVVNNDKGKFNFYFSHTYNFLFDVSLSRKDRELDIDRIVCYFNDEINEEELNFFKDMYVRNEAWSHCS